MMYSLISKSRIRSNLLKIFFLNKGKNFYIRELARIIETSAGNTRKELLKLEQERLLKSTKKANLVLFQVNEKYPLYKEFESIIKKTLGIEHELEKALKKIKGVEFAFIFGSYAKGDLKTSSDIDLFIIGDINEDDLITKIQNVETNTNREVDFHIAKPKEFLKNLNEKFFYKDIIKEYILLTENNDEFKAFIGQAGISRKAQKAKHGN